jgi:23S rRNA (uridine2552-2'-O)-methyltransferase
MSKTSKAWMQEHVNDTYVKQAQAQGFRSRAAYKLKEIDERDHLLVPGLVVVDLGAAPGSWTQVIAAKVGSSGKVIGLDLLPVDPIAGVDLIQGDFREDAVLAALEKALAGRKVDLVVSDMAPNISGISSADQARSLHLCELALEFACKHLKKGGNFQGAGFNDFQKELRRNFKTVTSRKPLASRDRSSEMYLLGKGLIDPVDGV